MTPANTKTLTNVALVIGIIFIACKLYQSNKHVEPYMSQVKYRSQGPSVLKSQQDTVPDNGPLKSSSSDSMNSNDTTDIYAGQKGAYDSNSLQSSLNGAYTNQNAFTTSYNDLDRSAFDLQKNDPSSFDYASLAGISKNSKSYKQSLKKPDVNLEYNDPSLPTQSMSNRSLRDPSDANTYMFDRNVFANDAKKRGRGQGDTLRGDIPIATIKRGMFDVSANPSEDLQTGYFQNFSDIQETKDLQDVIYENMANGGHDAEIAQAAQNAAAAATAPNLKFAKYIE